MEARKKRVSSKTTKRKSPSKSALEIKQFLDEKIKLYEETESDGPNMLQEPEVVYGKPKQTAPKSAAANQEIVRKLKALKELIGIAPGLWSKDEDPQVYINRLRDNDRF
jgi:hypothetical protein